MMRKVSFVGTALFGLIASAALLSSCGQKTETPTSPAATSPTPNVVSPVAGSSTTSNASPVADSSANTASPAAESTASNTTSTVAASPSTASADTTASTATPTDSTTASTTTQSPAATTASSTPGTGVPELISAAAFEEIDANKAGKITVEDFVGYYTEKADSANKLSKEDAQKKFKQLDKDNDGSLTKEEATGQK
ncbi:EF-hand domain-containing protein [Phormidium sp. LEGE 05292]|uniref:EF-hand domain-containing protein n=1 Tax=[Phormidium] sp. LEGE 05292 TaxID=767427 RepID=UPI00187F12AC|nr:EF-hand domain-containing protein [Phormidium sp. LEGE 05292]MBE9225907.1 EF-hand domain-containing protein [Phormidium sp. LEGE 05292]